MTTIILSHFKKADPTLYEWASKIQSLELLPPANPDTYFARLCYEIISQQLAGKAADAIHKRFVNLFKKGKVNPQELLKIPHETLRAVGMSNAKARYVKNLAENVISGNVNLSTLSDLDDEAVIVELTKVKGIGRWTSEMFLMFVLNRGDVFSHGDLGLRNAMKKIYKFKREPSKKRIEIITAKWKPYRTYACRILWRSLEI